MEGILFQYTCLLLFTNRRSKMAQTLRIYNGVDFCHDKDCCPVVDFDKQSNKVMIHDPAKPENGRFSMTIEEFNTLLENAQPVV
jgi:hypothetical protein